MIVATILVDRRYTMDIFMNFIIICILSIVIVWSPALNSQDEGKSPAKVSDRHESKIFSFNKGIGTPSVIFVSGLGEDHNTWNIVQDSISRISATLSYDRAGLGKSEYHGEKKDLTSLAEELRELVSSGNVQKPLLLVGHSLGCQIIKKYVSLYPKDITGIVFIDPGYNEQKLRAIVTDSLWQKREATLKMYMPAFNAAQKSEADNLNTNCEIADNITELPLFPIILFTATRINPNFPGSSAELRVKKETHRLWLNTLKGARQIEVNSSRHYIHSDAPSVVINAIAEMIQNYR